MGEGRGVSDAPETALPVPRSCPGWGAAQWCRTELQSVGGAGARARPGGVSGRLACGVGEVPPVSAAGRVRRGAGLDFSPSVAPPRVQS